MSKTEKIILWIAWTVVALIGVGTALTFFGYLPPGRSGTTNVAVVLPPAEMGLLILLAVCTVSLAVWTFRRTRRKAS